MKRAFQGPPATAWLFKKWSFITEIMDLAALNKEKYRLNSSNAKTSSVCFSKKLRHFGTFVYFSGNWRQLTSLQSAWRFKNDALKVNLGKMTSLRVPWDSVLSEKIILKQKGKRKETLFSVPRGRNKKKIYHHVRPGARYISKRKRPTGKSLFMYAARCLVTHTVHSGFFPEFFLGNSLQNYHLKLSFFMKISQNIDQFLMKNHQFYP